MAQFVGIQNALVHQRVAFSKAEPSWSQAVGIRHVQGRKPPVVAVNCEAQVLIKKPADLRLAEQKTFSKPVV